MRKTIRFIVRCGLQRAKAVAVVSGLLFSISTLPASEAQESFGGPDSDFYGAIAYSPSTRRFGSSWDFLSEVEAEEGAVAICNRNDCEVVVPLKNNCGALAVARNGGYAWSDGATLYDAKLSASNECTRIFGSCKLICSVCSRGNAP